MKGLIRNHYYKIVSNLKILLVFIFIAGAVVLIFGARNEMLLLAFLCLTVIAFPFISSTGLRKNNNGKWNQYILTLPVKKRDIVKSVFITQLMIIATGSLLAFGVFLISFSFHGFAFYRYVDVFLLFSTSIGTSLIMNAIFFPISYLDSSDRTEATSVISLLMAVLIMAGLITVTNIFLKKPSDLQLIIFGAGSLILSASTYVLSGFLTVIIYSRKDC